MKNWRPIYNDLRALSLDQAGRFVLLRAGKGLRGWQNERKAVRLIGEIDTGLASVLNIDQDLASFLESKFSTLQGFPISPGQREGVAKLIHRRFPEWVKRCLDGASAVCEGRVSVLGHELCLDDPINWHKDHMSGGVWPACHPSQLRRISPNKGSDIKFVWELSRFHHGVTLGRAFALTGDERFARKFVELFNQWLAANPVYRGPNWLCAMEAAIRAVNLLWAGSLLAPSKAFDRAAKEAFVKSLLSHGAFIFHNLEYTERVVGSSLQPLNGNHYMANLAGLLHVSCAFPEYKHAREWRDFAQTELFRETRAQVDDEGVHYEYSPNYHRLVLEMLLACLILLDRQSDGLPDDICKKAVNMLDFIYHYRKPSGAVSLVRDVDSGRFCILGDEELQYHDHLLALGSIFFKARDLFPGEIFEDCLWHLGERAIDWHDGSVPDAAPPSSRLFGWSGFCVMRRESLHLLALCCPRGTLGFSGHTHNDFLSFELEAYGRTFLTDCGSYVYTGSPEWRNRMRSVVSHNTIVVDGREQNRFDPAKLFDIESSVRPVVKHWVSSPEQDVLDGTYTLVLGDGSHLSHERRFVFLKDRGLWLIRDRVHGTGRHTIETRFHFGEGIDINAAGERGFRTLCSPGPNLFLMVPGMDPLDAHIESGWVSRSYAAKSAIRVLRLVRSIILPLEQWYILAPILTDFAEEECLVSDWEHLLCVAAMSGNRST